MEFGFFLKESGADLNGLYLESQVSKGRLYSKGMGQYDKGPHPLGRRRCGI